MRFFSHVFPGLMPAGTVLIAPVPAPGHLLAPVTAPSFGQPSEPYAAVPVPGVAPTPGPQPHTPGAAPISQPQPYTQTPRGILPITPGPAPAQLPIAPLPSIAPVPAAAPPLARPYSPAPSPATIFGPASPPTYAPAPSFGPTLFGTSPLAHPVVPAPAPIRLIPGAPPIAMPGFSFGVAVPVPAPSAWTPLGAVGMAPSLGSVSAPIAAPVLNVTQPRRFDPAPVPLCLYLY